MVAKAGVNSMGFGLDTKGFNDQVNEAIDDQGDRGPILGCFICHGGCFSRMDRLLVLICSG